MTRLEKLNAVQKNAVDAWVAGGYTGTVILATGTGKSIVACKAIYEALHNGKLKKGDTIYFIAETSERETTFREQEFPFYEKITNKNILADFNVVFFCYQNKNISGSPAMIVYDEVQDALTDKYSYVLSLNCPLKLGLTATIPEHVSVYRNRIPGELINKVKQGNKLDIITDFINKGQLLEMKLPILFEYNAQEAIDDGVLSGYKTYLIKHRLDHRTPYAPLFAKTPKMVSEHEWYNVRQRMIKSYNKPKYLKANMARQCVQALYTLPSKIALVNNMIPNLTGKTLIAGRVLEPLRLINNIAVVEGETNLKTILDNNAQIIGTAQKLKQGATIPGLHNLILFSYSSSWKDFTQYVGRLTRYEEGKIGKVFIIMTVGTYEEEWVDRIPSQYDKELQRLPDLNMRWANDVYGI